MSKNEQPPNKTMYYLYLTYGYILYYTMWFMIICVGLAILTLIIGFICVMLGITSQNGY